MSVKRKRTAALGRWVARLAIISTAVVLAVGTSPAGAQRPSENLVTDMVGLGAAKPGELVLSLTFDDGPHPVYTPQILDILKSKGVKATFFVLGRSAQMYPDLIARIKAEGHLIASHSWDHPKLTGLSNASVSSQLRSTQNVLAQSGVTAKCLRPPYGANDARIRRLAADQGMRTVNWTIDPEDWRRPGAKAIADRVTNKLRPGAIILLHDGGGDRSQTVAALGTIIDRVQAYGVGFSSICK